MQIKIRRDVNEMVTGFGTDTSFGNAIAVLKWFAEDDERTRQLVKDYDKLMASGRREFQWQLLRANCTPDHALAVALKGQERSRQRHKYIGTVFARIRKAGKYEAKLPNGVPCELTLIPRGYAVTFHVQGKVVTVNYRKVYDTFTEIMEGLEKGYVHNLAIVSIVLDGRVYRYDKVGEAIIDAVAHNANPYVYAVVKGK